MEWYWYLIIVVGVLALGAIKIIIFNKYKAKKNSNKTHQDED